MSTVEIKKQLAERYNRSMDSTIFFEVKNGPTHFTKDLLILDALAIKKSWANPCFTGFEIKNSRSDFKRDEKWPGYLKYCHKFYFVCPKGMIKKEEIESVDKTVGLIYYSENYANKLHTVKAPIMRNMDIPPKEFLYYIITAKLEPDRYPFYSTDKEYFKAWLDNKLDNERIGWRVRSKILDTLSEQAKKLKNFENRLRTLDKNEERVHRIFDKLRKLGVMKNWNTDLKNNWEKELTSVLSIVGNAREFKRHVDIILKSANAVEQAYKGLVTAQEADEEEKNRKE